MATLEQRTADVLSRLRELSSKATNYTISDYVYPDETMITFQNGSTLRIAKQNGHSQIRGGLGLIHTSLFCNFPNCGICTDD